LWAAAHDFVEAVAKAGVVRLRPILMTSIALIAGMIPIAVGLNEASKQRTGMGVAVIGGVISSTLLTLIVVPAAFSYIERFRRWSLRRARKAAGLPEFDIEDTAANGKAGAHAPAADKVHAASTQAH
jgi:predicted RND superfamily exporter protein